MALDANLQIYSATVNANANAFNVQSNSLGIGRTGLPHGGQFYTSVQTANADRELTITLELSLDNGSTWRTVSQHVYDEGFQGKRVSGIDQDFNAQEYADANVDVRVNITAVNHANASNFGTVTAYLSVGESQKYGRKAAAETLAL